MQPNRTPNCDDMVRANVGLIYRVLRTFRRRFPWLASRCHDELVQVGRIALWKCAQKVETGEYDPSKAAWSTYATRAINNKLLSFAESESCGKRKRSKPMADDAAGAIVDYRAAPVETIDYDDEMAIAATRITVSYTGSLFDEPEPVESC
jgi:DNA-directed RNA polymerase specialized sigma subunit